MNWEKNKSHIALIDEIPHHIERVKSALGGTYTLQVVCSPFKLLSLLCAEKPDVIVINSAIGWCRTDFLCKAINSDPVLGNVPIVLYNTENTTVNEHNIGTFHNCHITEDPLQAAVTARRLLDR